MMGRDESLLVIISFDVTEVVCGGAGAQGGSDLIHGAEARDPGDGELVTRHLWSGA